MTDTQITDATHGPFAPALALIERLEMQLVAFAGLTKGGSV